MRRTTIKELGQNLPIGFLENETLQKSFSVRPYKARVDRYLGHWKESNEGRSIAYLTAKFLALITQQAGPHALALTKGGDSTDDGDNMIGSWYFADAMYIYVWCRIQELDPFILIPFKCPVCNHMGTAKYDLRDLDVDVAEGLSDLETTVTLRRDFKLRDGTKVKTLKLRPVPWAVMYHQGAMSGTPGSGSYAQIQHSIVGVNDRDNYTPLVEEIDEIHKTDMLLIDRAAGKVSAGLDLITTVDCPGKDSTDKKDGKCGFEIMQALDWSFDSFFESSFQLET